MSDKLRFLECQLQEARDALHEALRAADRLGLQGTRVEIQRSFSGVNGIIHEIEVKEQPEFAPYLADSSQDRGTQ